MSKLIEKGDISIQVRGDTKFEDAVMEMARTLAKEYLVPSLDNHGAEIPADRIPFKYVKFGFGSVKVEERKEVSYELHKQADVRDVRCIAAPFNGLSPYADKIISNTAQ